MKKSLSIILAIVMTVALLPTAFAENTTAPSGIKVVYELKEIGKENFDSLGIDITEYTYEHTNGFWSGAFAHAGYPSNELYNATMNKSYGLVVRYIGSWGAIRINVPVSGFYNKLTMKMHSTNGSPTDLDVYLLDKDTKLTDDLVLSSYTPLLPDVDMSALYVENNQDTLGTKEYDISKYIAAGEYYLIFHNNSGKYVDGNKNSQARIYTVTLSGGNGISPIIKEVTAPESIEAGSEASITSVASSVLSDFATEAENVSFSYKSSDDTVAKVKADGTVIGVSEGDAVITVTATSNSSMATHSATREVKIKVNGKKTETSPKTSLWIGDNIDGKSVKVTVAGEEKESETLLSETRGLNVKAIAECPEGYVFRGWVRGSADHGVWVSNEPEYSFVTMTHTMLTAVYEEITDGDVIEYYNENGAYIETRAASDALLTASEVPSLVGYTFEDWYVNKTTKLSEVVLGAVTRAVAKHTAKNTNATIKVNNVPVSDATFDRALINTGDNNVTCWKRNGEIVSYGKDYTYYIWGDTEITSSTETLPEKKTPIIYLDGVINENGARMIEYDKGDFEIVEVGILFGEADVKPQITSCLEKMNSQRNSSHGQFTATPSDAGYSARGYMIYRDNEEYKVIYAD